MNKEDAWRWFLAGFGAAGEGWNPDVLVDWDDPGSTSVGALRDDFENKWPEPTTDVRTAEDRMAFAAEVDRSGGLFGALPKIPDDAGVASMDLGIENNLEKATDAAVGLEARNQSFEVSIDIDPDDAAAERLRRLLGDDEDDNK